MKTISFWASAHRKTAIAFIIVIKISLALLAMFTAISLNEVAVVLPANGICIAGFLGFFAIASIYPYRQIGGMRVSGTFAKQKACDFLLSLLSFLCITAMINNADAPRLCRTASAIARASNPTTFSASAPAKMSPTKPTKETLSRAEKKMLRKAFFRQLRQLSRAALHNAPVSGANAMYIVLAIIAAVLLSFLLAMLVCNISCSGAESLALVVGVLGSAAIIGGLILVIKRITRPRQGGAATTKEA